LYPIVHICYVDESGGFEAPNLPTRGVTPVMAICGMILPTRLVPAFTRDFLALKREHYPRFFETGTALGHIRREIKGNSVLQATRSTSRNDRRQASRVRNGLLDLLEAHDVKIVGRVWVKAPSQGLAQVPSYCYAVQDIARHFSSYLVSEGSSGVLVCDSRSPAQDGQTSHSVFTDKFRTGSDPIPAIVEAPLFAHSPNHAGLQACDLIASTMLFPMSTDAYCATTATGAHASPYYADVREACGPRLRRRQYMYRDEYGRTRGGIVVSDKLGHQPAAVMFAKASAP
jgi:hypothetical protein